MEPALSPDWPLAEHSRFVRSRPHHWHLQDLGQGPTLLLIHGTGASTHSWRDLMPLLAETYRVVAIDLPGHGFTRLGSRMRSSLDCVSDDLAALCRVEGIDPCAIIGHSAGAAVALRCSAKLGRNAPVIGINPALQPFHGLAGVMFPVAARMMAMAPGLVDMLARSMASSERVGQLLAGTGSKLTRDGTELYARLFRDKRHVEGALLMMAQWKLDGLRADLPKLDTRALFLTGSLDGMVPPIGAVEAASQMRNAEARSLDGFGHLVHEEAPEKVAAILTRWLGAQ